MKPRRWPNGLGWSVQTRHGEAEVRDLVKHLRAFVPMAPRAEPLLNGKSRVTDRFRAADYPIGTDPAAAIEDCTRHGAVQEGGSIRGAVPSRTIGQTDLACAAGSSS